MKEGNGLADDSTIEDALDEIWNEYESARLRFPAMHSAHEGYAVLKEEVDELWHEVKHGTRERQREEVVQVAAMALAFLVECCS